MEEEKVTRRGAVSTIVMGASLAFSFGYLGKIGARFLTPMKSASELKELFIGKEDAIPVNSSRVFHDLRGGEVIVIRTKDGFTGFSNVCPHLGCHVHWIEDKKEFFCPCHLGRFAADGSAIAGPPKDANQTRAKVEVRHDKDAGNLFLRVPGRA